MESSIKTPTETAGTPVRIAVVIPCYRVIPSVMDVLRRIGPEVERIYCIDDACPEGSGRYIQEHCRDGRVQVVWHEQNQGVGGATVTGFKLALKDGAALVVKIDGDGQMDPALLPRIINPILAGRADYCKGNRFFNMESVQSMPSVRLAGNAVLSFVTKLSSGYWNIFDPTNGYVAIHARVLAELPLDKIHRRYFFESDMLLRLNTVAAVVEDVPMTALYGMERSNLRIRTIIGPFLVNHLINSIKRIAYNHFLRNFSAASVELTLGTASLLFGLIFGAIRWADSITTGEPVTAGTVMLAALPVILGIQFLLSFLNYDVRNVPQIPLHKRL
ncbi:MAG: glycosyl transferase family 2 [Pedosphaera sp.]|jgi:dolichol-phosphate mannosyltransferase|nr:glycosyl transferase family 2 [Pedosphaera sp.]